MRTCATAGRAIAAGSARTAHALRITRPNGVRSLLLCDILIAMTISIFGAGHLTRSLLQGMAEVKPKPPRARLYNRTLGHAQALAARFPFVEVVDTPASLVEDGGPALLIVPVAAVLDLDPGLVSTAARTGATLWSCAGGLSLDLLEARYPDLRWGRLIPNVNWQVGAGLTLVAPGTRAPEAETQRLLQWLAPITAFHRTADDRDFDRMAILTSCAPGMAAEWLTELFDAFGTNDAERRAVMLALRGTFDTLLRTDTRPQALIEQVANPGGMTATGVAAMREVLRPAWSQIADRMFEKARSRRAALEATVANKPH